MSASWQLTLNCSLTAPFNAEDKVKAAGSAEFAAKAGVAAIVEEDAVKAASAAAALWVCCRPTTWLAPLCLISKLPPLRSTWSSMMPRALPRLLPMQAA